MDWNLSIRSGVKESHLAFFKEEARRELGADALDEEVSRLADELVSRLYGRENVSLLEVEPARRRQAPDGGAQNRMQRATTRDLSVLFAETAGAGAFLKDSFNYAQSERKRILSQVAGLNSLVGDLNLIANDEVPGNLYFKESFESKEGVDEGFLVEGVQMAQVSTQEGVLTLGRSGTENLSLGATVRKVEGQGEAGTGHLVRRTKVPTAQGGEVDGYVYLNENKMLANDDASALLDAKADTIFEYQMVNVPDEFVKSLKNYDFAWRKSKKEGDVLQLRVVIELREPGTLNWINVAPYYPVNSTGRVTIREIRTSEDGFDYVPLFEGRQVLNVELNETAQTYRLDELFDGNEDPVASKFVGQGVFSFPARHARYVEFLFQQEQSYEELIGQATYWKRTTIDGKETVTQIPEPVELKDKPPRAGYTLMGLADTTVEKRVETTNGWRYLIGLRDLNLMRHTYAEVSEVVSRRYDVDGEIDRVMLYVNERVPEEYVKEVKRSHDWVRYEVSFDDVNWHPISPMHREPVAEGFAPKLIQVNGNSVDLDSVFQVHRTNLDIPGGTRQVRLRIKLSRPTDAGMEYSTPVVEDYAIRVIKKGMMA